jgi:hypothetical protein
MFRYRDVQRLRDSAEIRALIVGDAWMKKNAGYAIVHK